MDRPLLLPRSQPAPCAPYLPPLESWTRTSLSMLSSTVLSKLYKVCQRMAQFRPTTKKSSPCIGTFLTVFVPILYFSLTRPFLASAYTSKVLISIPLLKHARKIDFVIGLPATVGNVTSSRPAIWDMLGRAKWCVSSLV